VKGRFGVTDQQLREGLDAWYLDQLKNEWSVYWVDSLVDEPSAREAMNAGLPLLRVAYEVCYRTAAANLAKPPAKAGETEAVAQ
jgi:hypothetical protein